MPTFPCFVADLQFIFSCVQANYNESVVCVYCKIRIWPKMEISNKVSYTILRWQSSSSTRLLWSYHFISIKISEVKIVWGKMNDKQHTYNSSLQNIYFVLLVIIHNSIFSIWLIFYVFSTFSEEEAENHVVIIMSTLTLYS